MPIDPPSIVANRVAVTTKLINAGTLQEITNSQASVEVNSSQWLCFVVVSDIREREYRPGTVLLRFQQSSVLNHILYLKMSNAGYLPSSTIITLRRYVGDNGKTTYEADISDILANDFKNTHYFILQTASPMSFYTSHASSSYCPDVEATFCKNHDYEYIHPRYVNTHNYQIGDFNIGHNFYSGKFSMNYPIMSFNDELVSFDLSLVYSQVKNDTHAITTGMNTNFPKGWKLNIQQFIYAKTIDGVAGYIFVDENYKEHFFKATEANAALFFDAYGSYFFLKIIDDLFYIYEPNGNQRVFNSSGYLTTLKRKLGSSLYAINIGYDSNNRLTSVTYGSQTLLSVSYASTTITISPHGESPRAVVLTFNATNENLTSLNDINEITYSFTYVTYNNCYYISKIEINNPSQAIEFTYNVVRSLSYIKQKEGTNYYLIDGFTYDTVRVKQEHRPFNNSNSTYTIDYVFESNGQLVSTRKYKDTLTFSDSHFYDKGRLQYELNTDTKVISDDHVIINNQSVDLEANSFTVNNSTKIKISTSSVLSYLFFVASKSFANSVATSIDDTLNIKLYKIGVSTPFYEADYPLNNFLSEEHCFVLMPRAIINNLDNNPTNIEILFSHSNSEAAIAIKKLRFYCYNSSVTYYKLDICDNEITNPTKEFYSDPFGLTRSWVKTVWVKTSYRDLYLNHDDVINSLICHVNASRRILFYNEGRECIAFSETNYNNLKIANALVQTYSFSSPCLLNTFGANPIMYNSLSLNTFYKSGDGFKKETDKHEYCFGYSDTNKKTFNKYFKLISEENSFSSPTVNEVTDTTTYSYNSKWQLLSCDKVNNNKTLKSVTNTYGNSNKNLTKKTLSLSNYSKISNYSYDSYHRTITNNYTNGQSISFAYDDKDRLIQTSTSTKINKASFTNNFIKVTKETSSNLNTINYTDTPTAKTRSWNGTTYTKDTFIENNVLKQRNYLGDIKTSLDTYGRTTEVVNSSVGSKLVLDYYDFSMGGVALRTLDYYTENNEYLLRGMILYGYDKYGSVNAVDDFNWSMHIVNSVVSSGPYSSGYQSTLFYTPANSQNVYKTEEIRNCVNKYGGKFIQTTFYPSNNIQYVISDNIAVKSTAPNTLPWEYITVNVINGQSQNSDIYDNSIAPITSGSNEINIPSSEVFKHTSASNVTTTLSTITYTYGQAGNITGYSISAYNISHAYQYNSYDELSSETNSYFGTITYTYDIRGNVTGISSTNKTVSASYDSYNKMTSVTINGTTYTNTYDSKGYPTSYKGKTITRQGNLVTRYDNVYFEYDGFGRRYKKYTNSTNYTEYQYLKDKLVREKKVISGTTYNLDFIYGCSGIMGFFYNNTIYVFQRDSLGNVVAIYNGTTLIAKYVYDAYGNNVALNSSNSLITSSTHIANLNPIRYRSYYYDTETKLYFLSYRYYDPEIGRYFTPDDFDYVEDDKLNGLNLYVYCYNNPIKYSDSSGHLAISLLLFLGLTGASFAIGFSTSIITQGISYGWNNINGMTFLQAAIDGLFAAGTMALAYTGISLVASIAAGGIIGLSQYSIDSAFHNDFSVSGAILATILGLTCGAFGQAGAQNCVSIGQNLDDVGRTATKALLTAFDKYGYGAAYDATINLWGSRLAKSLAKSYTTSFIKSFIYNSFSNIVSSLFSEGINELLNYIGWKW